jgi:hypothetical protein
MSKILVGGIAGGVVLFLWGAFSHMVLPLGEVGVRTIPDEPALMEAMRMSMSEGGFYLFPGEGARGSEDERAAWTARHRQGPTGVIVYHPTGKEPMPPSMLLTELVSDILAALIAAFVVSRLAGARWFRLQVVILLGLLAWLAVDVPYWNWYRFPADFTLAALVDAIVAWTLVGFVVTWFVKGPATV